MWGETDSCKQQIATKLEKLLASPTSFQNSDAELNELFKLTNISDHDIAMIKNLRKLTKDLTKHSKLMVFHTFSHSEVDNPYRQPTGISIKYWICVAGFVTGMIAYPFCPPAGAFLMTTTGTMLGLDIIPTMVGNKIDESKTFQTKQSTKLSKDVTHQLKKKIKDLGISDLTDYYQNMLKNHPLYSLFISH